MTTFTRESNEFAVKAGPDSATADLKVSTAGATTVTNLTAPTAALTTATVGTLTATDATLTTGTVPTLGSTTATITTANVTTLNATTSALTTATATTLTATTFRLAVTPVAAAGANQGNAAALAAGINVVTDADGTKGVRLPTAVAGTIVIIKNIEAAALLKVYPATGAAINGLSANAALSTAEAAVSFALYATSATQWYTLPLLPS